MRVVEILYVVVKKRASTRTVFSGKYVPRPRASWAKNEASCVRVNLLLTFKSKCYAKLPTFFHRVWYNHALTHHMPHDAKRIGFALAARTPSKTSQDALRSVWTPLAV